MSVPNSVLQAIANVTSDPHEQAALLYACAAESGCESIQNLAGAPAYGPWQIYLPFHPGVTVAQADDPTFAANYIYTHRNVKGCVQQQNWTNPLQAAYGAARCIEGGTSAEPYSQAQRTAGENAAGIALSTPLHGTNSGSIPILSGVGDVVGNAANAIPGVAGIKDTAGALTGIAAMFAHVLDIFSSGDFWISILLVFIGIALVVVGFGKLASNSPVVQQAASVAPLAAAAA